MRLSEQTALETLESSYRALLMSALLRCAGGQWGLFGQNDAAMSASLRRRLRDPAVEGLLELGSKIDRLRRKLGYADPFPLHDRLLRLRSLPGSNILGEPKVARQWLDELALQVLANTPGPDDDGGTQLAEGRPLDDAYVSPDGELRFVVRWSDADIILGFDGYDWHTHGDLLVADPSDTPADAAKRFISELIAGLWVVAITRIDGTISDIIVTADPAAESRACLAGQTIEFRLWDGTRIDEPEAWGRSR